MAGRRRRRRTTDLVAVAIRVRSDAPAVTLPVHERSFISLSVDENLAAEAELLALYDGALVAVSVTVHNHLIPAGLERLLACEKANQKI
jgi:hypothetical protein